MGMSKEYRKGLKYRVASARCKTLEALFSVKFKEELGMSQTEARLLGDRIGKWVYLRPDIRGPNQIIFEASSGKGSFARRYNYVKEITLTAYDIEDLDLEIEFGLYAFQTARLLRMVEEAYSQDSLLSAKQLTLLLTVTPTALRKKIKSLKDEGIFVPIKGMGKKDRKKQNLFRSTWALSKYFQDISLAEIRKKAGLSKERFRNICSSFVEIVKKDMPAEDEEELQWTQLAKKKSKAKLGELKTAISPLRKTLDWDDFSTILKKDFNLSPIKLAAIKEEAESIISSLNQKRGPGDVIYWAVSAGEPAGKPLSQAKLVPTTLTLYSPADMPDKDTNRDINRVSDIKFKKAIRLAAQAKAAGAYLTYADLGYLLGIHSQAISRLIKSCPSVVVPLRGQSCDIGQGITHRKKIISLYLEMHTETEIASRTGHSYESIENYINEFANVYVLYSKGMPPALIRRVTGRSTRLISAYIELVEQYQEPEYAFRFAHLKQIFKTHNLKKNEQ
ncbi:MAG: DUF1670 domain-containing protein [Actinobacteria bacterium]|nr:DUF1670 domain-containing protein [Actinomycetota bacterium]